MNFAGVAGDANPIHWDEDAKLAGLPDVIAHGMLTMGLGAGFDSAWSGGPGAVTRYAVRLSAPAIVSATEGADIEIQRPDQIVGPGDPQRCRHRRREGRCPKDLRPRDVKRPIPLTCGRLALEAVRPPALGLAATGHRGVVLLHSFTVLVRDATSDRQDVRREGLAK